MSYKKFEFRNEELKTETVIRFDENYIIIETFNVEFAESGCLVQKTGELRLSKKTTEFIKDKFERFLRR